jgi:uncharacterized membrane protein YedE/YeeE
MVITGWIIITFAILITALRFGLANVGDPPPPPKYASETTLAIFLGGLIIGGFLIGVV